MLLFFPVALRRLSFWFFTCVAPLSPSLLFNGPFGYFLFFVRIPPAPLILVTPSLPPFPKLSMSFFFLGVGTIFCAGFGAVRVFPFNVAGRRLTTLNRKTRFSLRVGVQVLGFEVQVLGFGCSSRDFGSCDCKRPTPCPLHQNVFS